MGNVYHLTPVRPPPESGPRSEWLARHNQALLEPRGFEQSIVQFRSGLLRYGIEYSSRFEGSLLGQDGILGDAWLSMARSYLDLLNGEAGRLDRGTLDGEVRRWAERFGFEEEV